MTEESPFGSIPSRVVGIRWRLILKSVTILVCAFLIVGIVPTWLRASIPRRAIRSGTILLSLSLIFIHSTILVAVPIALVWSSLRIRSARRARRTWTNAGRILLLGLSGLLILVIGDRISAIGLIRFHRVPSHATVFAPAQTRTGRPPLSIVVVGESSARGEPYNPWLSIGQIVAWKLESVFPDREVRLEIFATGGICLEQAIVELRRLREHPDAILVYAGHNEFQARYGWDRNGAHYVGEFTPRSAIRAMVDLLSEYSNTTALAREIIDRQQIDVQPLPSGTRDLVDHPAFSASEYELLRSQFHWRLDRLADYCDRIGTIPILIEPASNDAGYPPNRSFLAPDATEKEREAFEAAFRKATELESLDPAGALAAFEELSRTHPEFAETHYRRGKLLRALGKLDEARREFVEARDRDGMPMRCPTDFRSAYRRVSARHSRAVFVDAPEILESATPDGLLDGRLFHDGQHPNLRSYTLIANGVLKELANKRAFGWPPNRPAPSATPGEVAEHFGMDSEKWLQVAERSAVFYERTGYLRHDSSEAVEWIRRYRAASKRIAAGEKPEVVDIGDLGL